GRQGHGARGWRRRRPGGRARRGRARRSPPGRRVDRAAPRFSPAKSSSPGLYSRGQTPRIRCPRNHGVGAEMSWISNVVRPKIRSFLKREVPENLWVKCPETGQMVFYKDLEANQFVIPGSNYHMRMSATARLKSLFDGETWFDVAVPEVPVDPLKFRDERRYVDRLKDARTKTGLKDAVKLGYGKLEGLGVVAAVQDFDFMGGSLGMAAGEAVIKAMD